MNHQTDTPATFSAVPGHTRLFRREGGTYYLRAKVPHDIRHIIGKTEIRVSLRTKNLKEALPKVKIESLRVDREFGAAEAKLKGKSIYAPKLSKEEMLWWTKKRFIELEQQSSSLRAELRKMDEIERRDLTSDIGADLGALNETGTYDWVDSSYILDDFLAKEGNHLPVEKGTEEYNQFLELFRRAHTENLERLYKEASGKKVDRNNFREFDEFSIVPEYPQQKRTLGQLLNEYLEYKQKTTAKNTPSAYRLPVRVLREVIGENTPIRDITKQQVEAACDTLGKVPLNATQRYPGLSIVKAIEAASRNGDKKVISGRTVSNYYLLIKAIFAYARDEGYMRDNPAKSRKLAELFKEKKKSPKQIPFTDEELQAIFRAPLYTGCENDKMGYNKLGPNVPRRGRFWLPLLALFGGLRCNEACQLYTEDIKGDDAIPFICVREDLDDGEVSLDKHLKNESSVRDIPIHPELLKMGFMDFVNERRRDQSSQRLFPELHISKATERYSHAFSKWWARFALAACGHQPQARFHNFRGHFRTALIDGHVQTELAEALGGWKTGGRESSERRYRHDNLPMLRNAVAKASYPNLDLSHLYFGAVDVAFD